MDLQKEQELFTLLNNITLGENGEVAFKSTGDKNLDLFGTVNRGADINVVVDKFVDAWNENPEYAIKVLLNFRDAREGKGEKQLSKIMLMIIKISHPEIYEKLVPLFIEVGCWKDVLFLYEMGQNYSNNSDSDTDSVEINELAKQLTLDQVAESPSLCAKWAPTEGCHFDRKTKISKKLMTKMNKTPKEYRRMLTTLRSKIKIVESQLSQQRYSEINFSTVPSRAHLLYKKAFLRETNASGESKADRKELMERYNKYLQDLNEGKEKVNFKGIMPHELVKEIIKDKNNILVENQWKAIRGEIENLSVFDRCISVVDVSGSMSSGGNGNGPAPMDVAVALGILVSECSKGIFKNKMFTFHEQPTLVDLTKFENLYDKVEHVKNMPWGGSTDIEAVFQKILDTGILMSTPQNEMPERLFIFTDMQFNQVSGSRIKTFDKIKEKFGKHGYKMPQIVCWNLRTVDNVVFTKDDENVCMLSGFSTPILKAFLTCKEISPLIVFLAAINHYKVPDIVLLPITRSLIDVEKLKIVVDKCDFKNVEKVEATGATEENTDDLSSLEKVNLARQLVGLDSLAVRTPSIPIMAGMAGMTRGTSLRGGRVSSRGIMRRPIHNN